MVGDYTSTLQAHILPNCRIANLSSSLLSKVMSSQFDAAPKAANHLQENLLYYCRNYITETALKSYFVFSYQSFDEKLTSNPLGIFR